MLLLVLTLARPARHRCLTCFTSLIIPAKCCLGWRSLYRDMSNLDQQDC